MFINISNHPFGEWENAQLEEAKKWGDLKDYPFPLVSPSMDEEDLTTLAEKTISDINELTHDDVQNCVLHIMGEMTLTYLLVSRFRRIGYHCVASTTTRKSEILADGTKLSHFEFTRFRDYVI